MLNFLTTHLLFDAKYNMFDLDRFLRKVKIYKYYYTLEKISTCKSGIIGVMYYKIYISLLFVVQIVSFSYRDHSSSLFFQIRSHLG